MATILVAGQDEAVLEILSAELIADGHVVIRAGNGLEAYEAAVTHSPALVFLDPRMPVFDGWETCALIHDDPALSRDLPVFMLTGPDVDPRSLEKAGATGRFSKQHAAQDLYELLSKYV